MRKSTEGLKDNCAYVTSASTPFLIKKTNAYYLGIGKSILN
jgi:hypothetical protein